MYTNRWLMSIMALPLAVIVTVPACQSSEGSNPVDRVKQGLRMTQQGMEEADDAMGRGDHAGLTAAVQTVGKGMHTLQQGMRQMSDSARHMMGGSSGAMMDNGGTCGDDAHMTHMRSSASHPRGTMRQGMNTMTAGWQLLRRAEKRWAQDPIGAHETALSGMARMRSGLAMVQQDMMRRGMMSSTAGQATSCGCQQTMDCAITGTGSAGSPCGGPSSCGCAGSSGGSCR